MKRSLNRLFPFRILKMVRDGNIKEVSPAPPYSESRVVAATRVLLTRLVDMGVLHLDEYSKLSVDPLVIRLFYALGVRLTDLEAYCDGSVVCNPRFQDSRRSGEYPSVFVLMPFRDELRPVYDDHIKSVVDKAGLTCARADDLFGAEAIINEIWSFIKNADLVIADCTGRNPNVFYEIGIAHTVGVPVILISQNIEDVPFDLRHQRVILYAYTPQGVKAFEQALAEALEFEGVVGDKRLLKFLANLP